VLCFVEGYNKGLFEIKEQTEEAVKELPKFI